MKRLTDTDIQALYDKFNTPPHVKGHCAGVAQCALKLAKALTDSDPENIHFDKDLIYGAGMVHDCARKFDFHEKVAAA